MKNVLIFRKDGGMLLLGVHPLENSGPDAKVLHLLQQMDKQHQNKEPLGMAKISRRHHDLKQRLHPTSHPTGAGEITP